MPSPTDRHDSRPASGPWIRLKNVFEKDLRENIIGKQRYRSDRVAVGVQIYKVLSEKYGSVVESLSDGVSLSAMHHDFQR